MDTFLQDVRFALRTLARQPGFTAIAVLTLAVGIGANTAIYSVVDATLLRRLPFREPDRLMRVSLIAPAAHGRPAMDSMVWSYPKYETFRQLQTVFEESALYLPLTLNLTGSGEPERLRVEVVTAPYFDIVGARPQAGRVFRSDEDVVPQRDMVALIGGGFWQRRFGGDPQAMAASTRRRCSGVYSSSAVGKAERSITFLGVTMILPRWKTKLTRSPFARPA